MQACGAHAPLPALRTGRACPELAAPSRPMRRHGGHDFRQSETEIMTRSVRAALTLLACLAAVVAAPRAHAQAPADSGRFEAEIVEMERGARRASPTAPPVLFVGSSSIRMWCGLDRDFPGLPVLNRGFGG